MSDREKRHWKRNCIKQKMERHEDICYSFALPTLYEFGVKSFFLERTILEKDHQRNISNPIIKKVSHTKN